MKLILAVLFCVGGFAVLVSLGVWQVQRLAWKEGVIAGIEARIGAEPVALPQLVSPDADAYLPVTIEGAVIGAPLRVFGAWRNAGTGHRVVVPFDTAGRRIMVDLGVAPEGTEPIPERLTITGNLDWPDESGGATPAPDGDLWFGRDVPGMAAVLDTEPVMVVARSVTPPTPARPAPVGVGGIPNNHLGYAIQWFGLAIVWAGMTAYLGWRIRRRTV